MGTFANVLFAAGIVVLALYVELPKYRDDPEVPDLIAADPDVRAAFFSERLSSAPSTLDVSGAYVWGRTLAPRFSLDLHQLNPVQLYTEMKEFIWVSVTSGPWVVGFAVMQLQYADNLVLQVFKAADGESGTTSLKAKVTIPLVSPVLSWGTEWVRNASGAVGPMSPGHSVLYKSPPWEPTAHAAIHFTETEIRFDVQATVKGKLDGAAGTQALVRLAGAARLPSQLVGLSYPLGPHRPSLVNKMAAVPLTADGATLFIDTARPASGAQRIELADGLLAMDYTRGLLRRHTQWYWSCLSDPRTGLGLHLSSGTYDVDGVSMEASLFDTATGTAAFLNEPIHFRRRKTDDADAPNMWEVRSPSLSLLFTSHDGYGGKVNLGLVNINLDHQWGCYSGTVRRPDGVVVTLESVPGVFEEHDALW